MAIILPPTVVKKAAQRFLSKKIIYEQFEGHILNFYEDMSMPLSELFEVIQAVINGELYDVQEKMDGQNLTFTVMNGELLFYSKGASYRNVIAGKGLNRDAIQQKGYNESVRAAFTKAYDALSPIAIPYAETLFQNGRVLVEAALLTPENPNTIIYDAPSIRFIKAAAVAPDTVLDTSSYESFIKNASNVANQEFQMGPVPYVKLERALEQSDALAEEIRSGLSSLMSDYGLSMKNTVGDLSIEMVKKRLRSLGYVPESLLDASASRIVTGKGSIANVFKKAAPESWPQFQKIITTNRAPFLAESILELESIIQKIGILAFRNIEFSLKASNKEDLVSFVKQTRDALSQGRILTDPKKLEGIRVALERIGGSEDLFEKSVEGIVFQWKGKTRKLTGLFTPINKLRGFFAYGGAQVQPLQNSPGQPQMESSPRGGKVLLGEGGNAFKKQDDQGNKVVVTSSDPIPRNLAEKIISDVVSNVISPLGLDYEAAGSTATDKKSIGDVDLIVSEPDVNKLILGLKSLPYLRNEIVTGVPRVLKLPGGKAATIMVDVNGIYYQVDIFTSDNISNTSWELSGGSEGKVKGVYHKLLLSLIAKIAGERESTPEKIIKYTFQFPGGLRKKVNGVLEEFIQGPDNYLPIVGINVDKSSIKTFEDLVDYIRGDLSNPILAESLERFEEYISNRLNASSGKVQQEAQMSLDYIRGQSLSEIKQLKEIIRLMF